MWRCISCHASGRARAAPTRDFSDTAASLQGWLSWSSIISWFVDFVYDAKDTSISPKSQAVAKADLQRLSSIAADHRIDAVLQASRPVDGGARAQGQHGKGKTATLQAGSSLLKVSRLLSRQHQAPVVDEHGKLVTVVSQRDVLQYLDAHADALGALGANTVQGLSMGRAVAAVRATDVAIDAFYFLVRSGFQGCAVTDDTGALTKNISVSDLARVGGDFTKLLQPVSAFASERPAVTVTATTTLRELVTLMATNKIRRVFIVKSAANPEPVAIITASDVMALVARALKDAKQSRKKQREASAAAEAAAAKGGSKSNKFKVRHFEIVARNARPLTAARRAGAPGARGEQKGRQAQGLEGGRQERRQERRQRDEEEGLEEMTTNTATRCAQYGHHSAIGTSTASSSHLSYGGGVTTATAARTTM